MQPAPKPTEIPRVGMIQRIKTAISHPWAAMDYLRVIVLYNLQGKPRTTPEQYQERLDICGSCDKRDGGQCSICHCVLIAKAMTGEGITDCPLGKWPKLQLAVLDTPTEPIPEKKEEKPRPAPCTERHSLRFHFHLRETNVLEVRGICVKCNAVCSFEGNPVGTLNVTPPVVGGENV